MYKNYDLSKILPHNPPMILIDELLNVDMENKEVLALVHITKDKVFYDETIKGVSALVGIEFMAQTIGCYAYFKNNEQEPKPGFLLGTRSLEIDLEKFELDKSYTVKAREIFTDNELVSFETFIYNDGVECARAVINAYQPEVFEESLLVN